MKTSFLTLCTISSIFSLTSAAPTANNGLSSRQTPADAPAALAIVDQLFTDVTQYTSIINSTAASLSSTSTVTDNSTAANTFTSTIASINTLVIDATSSVESLATTPATEKRTVSLENRQTATDPTGLAGELALVIEEIGGALNQIIATLGLTATLSFLGPLVGSLSGLLASLIPVVDNLLALVEALLDGILGGLSLALAGLVL